MPWDATGIRSMDMPAPKMPGATAGRNADARRARLRGPPADPPPKSQLHAPSRRTPRADRPGLSRYRESEPQNFWRRFFGGVSQSPVTRGTSPAVEASDPL